MTRETIETAMRESIPFALNVANGESYEVRTREGIALNSSRVVVVDERNQPHVFLLPAITSIRHLPRSNASQAAA